ncbi:glycoside hydrolase family 2 TIM barrel-domain containing protein [Flagellimonas sp.]|uniref:glycoside hydrolase family 2 TIM barrel-domain containing protein n=1 Tax=Flagellimonas sp. TaxID=2058762 RepID=UPI003F4A58EC
MSFFLIKIPIKNLPLLLVWLAIVFFNSNDLNAQITKSEIRLTDEGYRLFLNGEPFYIKGAGLDNGDMDALAQHGANSVRTWSTDNGKEVLDKAHKLGLKVMMGVWVGHERHGFDYNDKKAIKAQLERIRERVLALKDHPALMVWGVGNEMNLQSKSPNVWNAVNEIAQMIHEVDPNHLTTSPLAGINKEDIALIAQRAPDIDFLSVQLYGAMDILPRLILESEYQGPLLITEWGATGYWEVEKTAWGAPLENHSSKKADLYLKRYQKSVLGQSQQIIGSFVFLWGQKQERTPTWFGMFMPDGKETEAVDAMHYAWNGIWPKNRSPRLHDFTLAEKRADDNVQLNGGDSYLAEVNVSDYDKDQLFYRWEIMRESQSTKTGGDAEYVPESLKGLFLETKDGSTTFKAPSSPGAYRLFVYVEDGHSHVAHANIPFWVRK